MTANGSSRDGLLQENKDRLQCGVCGQWSESVLKFIQHKVTHVDRGVGRGCEICHLAFSRQTALFEHYRRKHNIFFDSASEEDISCARLKNRVKEKEKDIKEKKKSLKENNSMETRITLTENIIQKTVGATINLPNDVLYDMKLENNDTSTVNLNVTQADDTVCRSSDTATLEGPTSLNKNVVLAGMNSGTLIVSAATAGTVMYGNTLLTGSSVLVGSSTLTDSSALSGSSASTCSTTSDNILALPDSTKLNHNSSLVNLYEPDSFHNHVEYVKIGNTSVNETSSNLFNKSSDLNSGSNYLKMKSFSKLSSQDETTCKQSESEMTDISMKPVLDEAFTGSKHFIAKKLDISQTEAVHASQKEPAKIILLTKNSVVTLQNSGLKNDKTIDTDGKIESENSENVSKEGNDNTGKSIIPIAQSQPNITPTFKKRGKLAPVPGKIPQELDMPDFFFLYGISKSGKSVKNMHAGKDQFKCLFCTYVVRWRTSMCRHMREDHDGLLQSGAALTTPLQPNTEEEKLMKMTEYIDMEINKKPNKRVRGVESQDLPGDYPCEQCGKVFNRLRYLRLHLQNHKRKKDFLCALCTKTFKTQNNLIQHLKTHEEREPYKCPECDFESAVNIAIHKHRQIHNANSLICDICGQAYSDKSTLKKHKRVHDPSRPFGCSIPGCTWRFRTKVMCDAHIQGHGSKRTFKCDICGYAFRQKHHLQRHEKVVHNIVHEPKPSYTSYYQNADTELNETQFEEISNEDQNEMEVSQGVNLIINEGHMSNIIAADNFDLESALQNGQLVIATDDGNINYEMSDINSQVVYQTLLPDGEVQQFETQTICIPQSDASQMAYEEVETIQSEVEIEQS